MRAEDETLLLSTAYLAPVAYYRQMYRHDRIIIERHCNYVKQTYRNRCKIASANGVQTLSIPVVKPETAKCPTRDICIADHGNWRRLHWQAIVSAYNSTPFFEYYADDFRPFYEKKFKYLFDFNEELREWVCAQIDIPVSIRYSEGYIKETSAGRLDLRETIHPKKEYPADDLKPYYQVFESRYGFQANLSIIDLLFNMGPETAPALISPANTSKIVPACVAVAVSGFYAPES